MRFFTLLAFAVLLAPAAGAQSYCMLPGRTPYSTDQPGITNFKLNTINRTSAGVESMTAVVVETGDTTVLLKGHTYTVNLTHSEDAVNFPGARNNIRVWVDYNNNKSFDDAGELVITADLQPSGVFTGTFTVPATATAGVTRLRATAKMSADAGHTTPTSCDAPADPLGYHGEMEDYVVKIQSSTAVNELTTANHSFTVYPNPAADQVTIAFAEAGSGPVSIGMYDVTGRQAAALLEEKNQSSALYRFNLEGYALSPGTYFIRVAAGYGFSYERLVITK